MARYFTSKDRDHVIKVSTIWGTLNKITEEMAAHNRPKEWLKALRTAKTWVDKANKLMAAECSDQELLKLWKYYEKFEVMLLPGHEAKQVAKDQDLIMMSRDAVFDLAAEILDLKCDGCQITDHGSCKYRKTMMAAGVVAWEDQDPEICQYYYNSKGIEQ